jgi:hypothetical protein
MLKFTNINEKHGLIEYSVECDKGEVSGRIDFYKATKVITFNLKAKTVPGHNTTTLEDIGLFLAALGGDILIEAKHPIEEEDNKTEGGGD